MVGVAGQTRETPDDIVVSSDANLTEAERWVNVATKKTARQRKDVLRNWVLANKLLPSIEDTHGMTEEQKTAVWRRIYEAAQRGISALRAGSLGVYPSINAMIEFMEERGCSPSTISGHRFKLVDFYSYYLKLPIDRKDVQKQVRRVRDAGVTADRNLNREEVSKTLTVGGPKQKAMISFMVNTGARLGETVRVKFANLELDKKPGIVRFPASITKTKEPRFSFLSSECVDLLKAHIVNRDKIRQSVWLFDGWSPSKNSKRNKQPDQHISEAAAYAQVRQALALAGLVPPMPLKSREEKKKSWIGAHNPVHPHVLRATNLQLTKSAGYPTDWAEQLVGHETGTQKSYLPAEQDMANEWLKKCEPYFCFLSSAIDPREVSKRLDEIEKAVNTFKLEGNPDDKVVLIKDTKTGEIQGSLILPSKGNGGDAKRWSNHKWEFAKCEIGSDEFDKALEEGYEVFTQAEKLAYLRKARDVTSSRGP